MKDTWLLLVSVRSEMARTGQFVLVAALPMSLFVSVQDANMKLFFYVLLHLSYSRTDKEGIW